MTLETVWMYVSYRNVPDVLFPVPLLARTACCMVSYAVYSASCRHTLNPVLVCSLWLNHAQPHQDRKAVPSSAGPLVEG